MRREQVCSSLWQVVSQRRSVIWLMFGCVREASQGEPRQHYRYAIKLLEAWCRDAKVPPTVEAITKRLAGRFITEKFIELGAAPATANKTITALRSYWGWLYQRGHN